MSELKGFIEVNHENELGDEIYVHYTQIYFIKLTNGINIAVHNGKSLKESYEEIKELIKKEQQ